MALKRTLVQEEYLMISTGSDPATGYLSFYPKADGNFYKRTSAGVETKLWDSTNDGTGSGLDADLLDGYHASDFQLAITNPITGTGTANYIPKFTAANQLGNSIIYETGSKIGIDTTAPSVALDVNGTLKATSIDLVKPALNSVNVQLNTPTVEEMALIHGVMHNKLRFRPPNLQEESSDGTNWVTSSRATANQLADMMIGQGQGTWFAAITISSLGQQNHYRLTWDYFGTYTYLNALYIYGTFYNNVSIKIEGLLRSTEEWTTITEGTVTGAPRHIYIPHQTLALHPSNFYSKARITFSVFSSTTTGNVTLNQIEWLGAYPAGRRNVETYDRDKNVTFPNQIIGQSFKSLVPTGTAPFVIASTTLNTNLNADLLDGYHASAFALAGSGVTSFNTRTGAVTLTKADVEAVLTGVITSHTHNYLSGSGTANYLSKFAAAGVLANSVIYEEDGLVGIGTNSPAHELHVNGTIGASQIMVQSGNDVLLLTGTYLEFGDSFNYNALFKVNANSIEISGNDMNNWTAFPISIGSVGGGFGNGRYIKIDDTLDTFTINFSKVKLPLGTANAFVKTNGSKELVYDTNSYALNNHTHSTYVLKAGDTMTGDLLIHKTNSGSVNAQFGIKADATSNRYHEFRITSISDSDIYETALKMFTPTPTIYSMLIGNVGVERGAQLFLGGANWDSLSIFASTDVIGNAAYVYVCDASDNVKKVPVASFGGGSGLTSVGLKMPNIFNVSNSPLIANGDIVVTLNSQAKSNVLISPNNSAGVPQFRALTAEDMPDLSQMFDNYLGWNMQVNSNPQRLIVSTAQTPSINQSKGIKFISGTNVTLNQTEVSGISNITINQSGGSLYTTQVTLNQSPAPISSGTWTDVPTMLINTWGDGTYLVSAHVNMAKATTGAGTVGMRVIDNASSVIASKEHYMASTTTNRASLSFVSSFVVSKSSPSSVKMQIHSNTTGWSAIATTLSAPISDNATQILVIKIA